MDIVSVVIAIVVLVIGIVGGLLLYAKSYVRIPPHKAMVVFGRRTVDGSKFIICKHGGRFVVPIFEDYGFLPLEVFTVNLELKDMWTKDRIRVEVKAIVQFALKADDESLANAATNFFKKDDAAIKEAVEAKLTEAGLDVMRGFDGDQVSAERTKVSEEWKARTNKELKALGIEVKTIVLQHDMKIRRGEAPAEGDLNAMKAHLRDLKSELAVLEGKLVKLDK